MFIIDEQSETKAKTVSGGRAETRPPLGNSLQLLVGPDPPMTCAWFHPPPGSDVQPPRVGLCVKGAGASRETEGGEGGASLDEGGDGGI